MFTAALFGFTLMNGIYPVLFNLYLLRLGYGLEYIGQINAIGMLCFALASYPAGMVANRWGLKHTMAVGVALAALCHGLLPMVEFTPPSCHATWIFIQRFGGSVGFAFYFTNMLPYLTNITLPLERNHFNSVQSMVSTLAGFAGSVVGGLLPGWFVLLLHIPEEHPATYRYSLMLSALLCVPGVLALLAMRSTEQVPEEHAPTALPSIALQAAPIGIIAMMALASMLRASGVGISRTFFNVYLDDGLGIATAQIGLIFAVVQLVAAPIAMTMPWLAQRWGNYRVILYGSLGIALSLLPLVFIPHWLAALAARLGIYAFAIISDTALNVYKMDLVASRWRTAMASVTNTVIGLSWTALSLGGGYLVAALSYRALFLLAIGLTLSGVLCFWAYFRHPRGELVHIKPL